MLESTLFARESVLFSTTLCNEVLRDPVQVLQCTDPSLASAPSKHYISHLHVAVTKYLRNELKGVKRHFDALSEVSLF